MIYTSRESRSNDPLASHNLSIMTFIFCFAIVIYRYLLVLFCDYCTCLQCAINNYN